MDKPGRSNDDQLWFGAKSMYDSAGFEEVVRRKPQRPIVRLKPVRANSGQGANPAFERTRGSVVGARLVPCSARDRWRAAQRER